MKTFLKVLLVAALLIVAIKFSPIIFLGAIAGLVLAGLLGIVGFSLILVLLAIALTVALALAPIWVPVLVIMGLVSLFRRDERPAPPPSVPPAAAVA
jgi:hypothetical protein